ncbi:InlB B-repeat-containing protein [Bifidobacterium sp. ESL0763]|uniref:leucine-rich repeat domain-containing protein n=1 Tax=Bifidobacterium sp. ESL0763 TaxID=2983227 RepID=UPI0023F87969|nr:leucine-rich repeat domain-containing protein [Bifidobacterium sp. ESL0763]MDF7663117.1 InlB B-repeat-containing protein [Bifidobacterium sp. ESL0763]
MKAQVRALLFSVFAVVLLSLTVGAVGHAVQRKSSGGYPVADTSVSQVSNYPQGQVAPADFRATVKAKGNDSTRGNRIYGTEFDVTYPLSYDANGGTGTVPTDVDSARQSGGCAVQHAAGETVDLPTGMATDCWDGGLSRTGMKFVGWSTTKYADPFATLADAESHVMGTLTMPQNAQTMYAVWVKAYTVTFKTQPNVNGHPATSTLSTQVLADGEAPTAPAMPTSYNPGVKFMGWGTAQDTDADGEGLMDAFDVTKPVTGNVTVWPLWGYEDTSAGHRCVMGVDALAQCFPDTALASWLKAKLSLPSTSSVWTQRFALGMQGLYCQRTGASDLDGVQTLTNLQDTDLSDDHFSGADLHQFKYLFSLTGMTANRAEISDISNLSGLTNLTYLSLQTNQIDDIDPLANMTRMYKLFLDHNEIVSISSLSSMTGLNTFGVSSNRVTSAEPLRHLSALEQLWIHNNELTDVSPLAGLTNLKTLYIGQNHIYDISSLSGLTKLTSASPYQGFYPGDQTVTLPATVADPGISMPTAVSVDGSAVEPTSSSPASPSAGRLDAQAKRLIWPGPMTVAAGTSVSQTFSKQVALGDTTGTFSGTITESYTVKRHTVGFDTNNGDPPSLQPSSVSAYSGYKITAPTTEPTRLGYRFTGWYPSVDPSGVGRGDAFDFANDPVTEDMTLHAGWRSVNVAIPLTGASKVGALLPCVLVAAALGAGAVSGSLRRRLRQR